MIQLILARTVSSLCNCVTYFSGGSRSAGPNFHYRGFNKTRNDQTEYEIDSLLMEDDLVDELVATPLSAEEIAAKLSNSNAKNLPNSALGGREANLDGSNLVRGADIWMGTTGTAGMGIGMGGAGSTSMGIGGRMERNENKISNDWWSDGDEDDGDDPRHPHPHRGGGTGTGCYGFSARGGAVNGNHMSEKIINATFFNGSPGLGASHVEEGRERGDDSYSDDLCFKGGDLNNDHHQLIKDSCWDKDFFDKDVVEENSKSFDFAPMIGNQENSLVHTDLNKRGEEEEEEIIFGGQKDPLDYINSNSNSSSSTNNNSNGNNGIDYQSYEFSNVSGTINSGFEGKMAVPLVINNSQSKDLLEEEEEDDFGNFASGNSPSNMTKEIHQSEMGRDDHDGYLFESTPETGMVIGGELPLRSGYSFDQETDDISLREGTDGMNSNKVYDFSSFAGAKKDEPPQYIPQKSSFDYMSFEGAKGDNHVQVAVRQEPENARGGGGGSLSFGEELLDDFDDIFNSSLVSNDNKFGQDKGFQDHRQHLEDGPDDEFGMFDFVSAKQPPPVNDHHRETPPFVQSQHHPSILLD